MWERKDLRLIYGGVKVGDIRIRRTNDDIMGLFGETSITGVIKSHRLGWLGHLVRMPDDSVVKVAFKGGIVSKKKGGVQERSGTVRS